MLDKTNLENYEAFFNSIDDFLFVLDEQGNILHVNNTVISRLEYKEEELMGKSVLLVHPEERRQEAGRIVGEMLSGKAKFCPVPIISKSGMQIPVETRITHGSWDGKPVLFGVTKDVSQVKFSEEKFSKIFSLNPSACGLTDLENHKYIEVNDAFSRLLGFSKEEVIGKTSYDLGILSQEVTKEAALRADKNGKIVNFETNLKAKNGDIKNVILFAENIFVQDKKYRFTVVDDITERKKIENELKQISERLSLATRAGGVGIWDYDVVNNKLIWDEQMYKLYGITADKFSGAYEAWRSGLYPEDMQRGDDEIQMALRGEKEFNTEFRVLWLDGAIHYIRAIAIVQRDSSGKPLRMVGTNWDITDHKQTEEQFKKHAEELGKMNRLMIGRELEMVELKKEIAKLKENTN